MTPKAQAINGKTNQTSQKCLKFMHQKTPPREKKDKPQDERKCLQIMYLIKDWYPEQQRASTNQLQKTNRQIT